MSTQKQFKETMQMHVPGLKIGDNTKFVGSKTCHKKLSQIHTVETMFTENQMKSNECKIQSEQLATYIR